MNENGRNNILREKINESAAKNTKRHLNGRRYDRQLMLFSIYLRISGGRKTYETIKNNNDDGMPSIHSVDQALSKNKITITETYGACRLHESLEFANVCGFE